MRVLSTIGVIAVAFLVAGVFVVANRAPDYAAVSIETLRRSGEPGFLGKQVEIEGVVVGDFRQPDQLGGIFLQQLDTGTSNGWRGVFVQCSQNEPISVGDRIRVRGMFDIEESIPQIIAAEQRTSVEVEQISHIGLPEPVDLMLPAESKDWESVLGMLVGFSADMVVSDTYNWSRYGQVILTPENRRFIPTNHIDPNDADPSGTNSNGTENSRAVMDAEKNDLRQMLLLDDGLKIQNPKTLAFQPAGESSGESLRLGTRIKNLKGIVARANGQYIILPFGKRTFEYAKRPSRPEFGNVNVTVASFNVLNFFTTIDNGDNGARGADSEAELDRQRKKLVASIVEMDADILGLMELENNLDSEQNLVSSLNETIGSQVYAGVGLPDQFSSASGGKNPIRVGLIYRRDRVETVGNVQMVNDDAFDNARTPLAQVFRLVDGDSTLMVIVNHFKSKGSNDAEGDNVDQNDGQGSYNASRRDQAAAIVRYVQSIKQASDAEKVLVIGDLNAYAEEDPIDLLRDGGLVDLLQRHEQDEQTYSYVYKGRAGCLDHAFATPELARNVVGAAVWHINSDEPRCLDYNLEYNPKAFYRPDPFRSSDHDPVLIGIRLE